jgi:hypothetical protein
VILIVGPIWFWNYWSGEIKREEERNLQNMNRHIENFNWQMPEGWKQEQERQAGEWKRLEEEIRRSQIRR